MQYNLLIKLLKQNSIVYNLPIYLYKKNERLETFEPFEISLDILTHFIDKFDFSDTKPQYFLSKDFVLIGRVFDVVNQLDIIIGPVLSRQINNEFKGIIFSNMKILTPNVLEEINAFFRNSTQYPIEKFLPILTIFHGYLNNEFVSSFDIIKKDLSQDFSENIQFDIINDKLNTEYIDALKISNYTIESQILYLISRGQSDKLRALQINQDYNANMGNTSLRYFKNALIILNSLCVRAAILGGLDMSSAYHLGEIYLNRIENCKDINSLLLINLDHKLLIDYSERVSSVQNQKINDIKINKAINYIKQNLKNKLTVEEIAQEVELSKEYLSTKFHKVTGVNLPTYVNQLKINEAAYLLLFTDMSLIEISGYLSFSSQAYFQTTFKKFMNKTPNKYKSDGKLNIYP